MRVLQIQDGVCDQPFVDRGYGLAFWIILESNQVRDRCWLDNKRYLGAGEEYFIYDPAYEGLVARFSIIGNGEFPAWFGRPAFAVWEVIDDERGDHICFSTTFDSLNGFSNICNLAAMISVGGGLGSRTSVGEGEYGDATHIQVHVGLWP